MKHSFLILAFLFLINFEGYSQLKIGYTNPEVILAQLPEVQEIDIQVSNLLEEKDSLLAIKAIALQQELTEYEQNRNSMTQAQRQQKESELTKKNDEFEQERQKSINEVQQKQLTLLRPVQQKVFSEIQKVADSLDLDLVLNQGSVNGGTIIFYASEDQQDITQQVLNNLKQS